MRGREGGSFSTWVWTPHPSPLPVGPPSRKRTTDSKHSDLGGSWGHQISHSPSSHRKWGKDWPAVRGPGRQSQWQAVFLLRLPGQVQARQGFLLPGSAGPGTSRMWSLLIVAQQARSPQRSAPEPDLSQLARQRHTSCAVVPALADLGSLCRPHVCRREGLHRASWQDRGPGRWDLPLPTPGTYRSS